MCVCALYVCKAGSVKDLAQHHLEAVDSCKLSAVIFYDE